MACLTIHSNTTIFPKHPTPTGTLSLSECDQLMPWTHSPTIYVYKTPPASLPDAVESLKSSLSEILVPYYPLTGRLRSIGGGRLELDCCTAGAEFIEASTTATLEDYGDFVPSETVRELCPKVDYNTPIEDLSVCLVQVTRFGCGGVVIGICLSHIVFDGQAAMTFINSWASMARGEKTVETILQPFHDRKVLQLVKPFRPPRFEHVEYNNKPPFLLGPSDEKEKKKETVATILKLSKEQVEELKKRANLNKSTETRPYSRYESVAGYIWVCACKARSTGESSQPTKIRIAIDIRKRLLTPIPENFTGNSILVAVTPECQFGDLTTKPLSYASGTIREGTWNITDEYCRSALDFLAGQEDIRLVRVAYHTAVPEKAPFWGNPNLALGSWITLQFYEADFGWGSPCYAGPTVLNTDGKAYIMPAPIGHGGLFVAIRLQKNHMDLFKKNFYQDL